MYETIYYNVVEYGDVLHFEKKKKTKEDCIFQENIGLHVFCIIQNYKTTFNAVRQSNGTCDMTDLVSSHLGIVYQSFPGPNSTVQSCIHLSEDSLQCIH